MLVASLTDEEVSVMYLNQQEGWYFCAPIL